MFTGIVEKTAQILSVTTQGNGIRLTINTGWHDIQCGESICVNGTCLTALGDADQAEFDISPETLDRTTFSQLNQGDWVNLERSMPANGRFSGHYVTGHIDTRAKLIDVSQSGEYSVMTLSLLEDKQATWYLIPKGSITVNGISLTINHVKETLIEVMIIPHTLVRTNLSNLTIGQLVNIEFDYFAKIIAHQVRLIQKEVQHI